MTYKNALNAYQRAQHSAMSPVNMEKAVFARAISLLDQARDNALDYPAYAHAVKFNQRLWTYIQSQLTSADADMPRKVRENLLNLSLYIDQHTIRALATPAPGMLDALIDINKDVSRGLGNPPPQTERHTCRSPSFIEIITALERFWREP